MKPLGFRKEQKVKESLYIDLWEFVEE